MSLLGDIFYGLGRFFRGLFERTPPTKRIPTARELDEEERDAEDEATERLKERFR